jgi:GntR family transcriptional regulator, galactonate operon transcriptional repressor
MQASREGRQGHGLLEKLAYLSSTPADPGGLATLPTGAVKTAALSLGRAIVRGEHPPGSVLPVEGALCADLGVSRTTLREAIKVLAGKGLVRTARRYGTRVCPSEAWNLLDADLIGWLRLDDPLTRWFMFDLVELRRLLEPEAAALAAERATTADIDQLRHFAFELGSDDLATVLEADVAFHMQLWSASKNLVLVQLSRPLGAMLRGYFRLGAEQVGTYWGNPDMHRAIAEAVAVGDAGRARRVTLEMLELNRREAEAMISNHIGFAAFADRGTEPDGRASSVS